MPKIFISRQLQKESIFRKRLQESGFEVLAQSLIDFFPESFLKLPQADWLFFYSKKGVQFFFKNKPKNFSKKTKWAAMGEGTATALAHQNISLDFIGDGSPETTAMNFFKK